jgi:O-antigen/teichoic acid export membrane protein
LLIVVPVYYYLGIDGIVPAIIITAIISLLLSWYYSNKIETVPVKISKQTTITEGENMLIMGFMISLSGLITVGASYIVRLFISKQGGVAEVGMYTAGFAIINTYVGLVFTAMGTDYYPRLSAVAHNNKECMWTINQQAEIAILILAPIILGFLIFIKWIIIILYSNKFVAVEEMVHWAAMGMFFKATSWSIAFILLAKGAKRIFFINELISNIYMLCLHLLGYYFLGLAGLGISFMIGYLFYLLQVYYLTKIRYHFRFDPTFIKLFAIQLSLAIGGFVVAKLINNPHSYFIGTVVILTSTYYSYKELDKRLDVKELFNKLLKK